jgi:hypothetical protein
MSSEKHETTSEAGVEGRGSDPSRVAIAAEVMGGNWPLLEPPEVVSRASKVAKTWKLNMPAKLYSYDTLFQGLAQHLQQGCATISARRASGPARSP